jgi:hypothetical protein
MLQTDVAKDLSSGYLIADGTGFGTRTLLLLLQLALAKSPIMLSLIFLDKSFQMLFLIFVLISASFF